MSKLGRYSADRKKIETLTADKTVEVSDCGTLFILNVATGLTASLPNASDAGNGWWCKFVVRTAPTSPVFIDATAGDGDNIHGVGYCVSGSGADGGNFPDGTNGSGVDRITLHGGATSRIGDQVELVCDGTNWYATALAFNVNGITYD